MIFLTVGTQFPFDRLVQCTDEFISRNGFEEEIFAQVAETSYKPRNFDSIPFEVRLIIQCNEADEGRARIKNSSCIRLRYAAS